MAGQRIKDRSICELVARLDLPRRGWQIAEHWEADLLAVGIASGAEGAAPGLRLVVRAGSRSVFL